jgi:hypothetical protein
MFLTTFSQSPLHYGLERVSFATQFLAVTGLSVHGLWRSSLRGPKRRSRRESHILLRSYEAQNRCCRAGRSEIGKNARNLMQGKFDRYKNCFF